MVDVVELEAEGPPDHEAQVHPALATLLQEPAERERVELLSTLTGAYSVVRGGECAILAVMKEFAIPGVKAAIFRLREIQAKAFGSEEHGFQINPVLSESEASAFEQDHKIVLPSDYRWQFCSWSNLVRLGQCFSFVKYQPY